MGEITDGDILASYASGAVRSADSTGGLVGDQQGGAITASYASGAVSSSDLGVAGGLTGNSEGTVTGSYWDTTTSGEASTGGDAVGKSTSQLQTPTAYGSGAEIYANWNINVDQAAGADDPWDFGTGSQYPALKVDFDRDDTPTAYEFGRQGRSAPVKTPGPVSRIYGAFGEKALRFTWSAPTTGGPVETYQLELKRVAPSSMTTGWVTVGHDITATRFDALGLTPGAKYQVRIRARNAGGPGTWTAA